MAYLPAENRYDEMLYNRCGRSGLMLPAISLGLWHNFGEDTSAATAARDLPHGLRSRHHAFRSRQQLRPASRLGRDAVRRDPAQRFPRPARRAGDLHQGRLPHVAGALRRVGQPQISALQPRPEPQAHGARLCRHLLFAPLRSRTRRWKRPCWRSTRRCGRARRSMSASPPTTASAPARRSRSCANSARPASSTSRAIPCSTAGSRRTACSTRWRSWASARIVFSPLAQGMLTTKYLDGIPDEQPRRAGQVPAHELPQRGQSRAHPRRSTASPSGAARRWRRWRSPGCCAAGA